MRSITGVFSCVAAYALVALAQPVNAQDTSEDRPWLEGLPIVEQSLELPEPSNPDLSPNCEVPAEFKAIEVGSDGSAFTDSRYLKWVEDFHRCRYDDVLRSVESDLRSGNAHPLAAVIWTSTQRANGGLRAGWQSSVDSALLQALGPIPEGYRIGIEGSPSDLVAYNSTLTASQLAANYWNSNYASWANNELGGNFEWADRAGLIRANPNDFGAWWPTVEFSRKDWENIKGMLSPGGELAGHFFADTMLRFLFEAEQGDADEIAAVDAWLARFPNDYSALRFKSYALEGLGRYDEAAQLKRKSIAIAPYRASLNAAAPFFRLEQPSTGDAIASSAGQVRGNAVEKQYSLASARNRAEFGHEARAAAARALAIDPQHLATLRLLYGMERDSKRPALALDYARRAWASPKAGWADAANLLTALQKDGLGSETMPLYDQAQTRLGGDAPSLALAAAAAADAMGDSDRAVAIINTARAAFPSHLGIMRRSVDLHKGRGENPMAVARSRDVLGLTPGFQSDYVDLYDAAAAINGSAGISEVYQWAQSNAARQDYSLRVAIDAYRKIDNLSKVRELSARARADYPSQFWPTYAGRGKWGTAEGFASLESAVLPKLATYWPTDREWAVRNLLINGRKGYSSGWLQRSKLEQYEKLFRTTQGFMTAKSRFNQALPLYEILDRPKPVKEAFRNLVFAAPEDTEALKYMGSKLKLDASEAFESIRRALQRNRYDSSNSLNYYMKANSLWGGSPILSYCLAEWAETHYADAVPALASAKTVALNRFGEDGSYFRSQYANRTAIHNSARYIGWYHTTKSKALRGSSFVDLDCDRGIVSTVGRDGTVRVKQHEYSTGKLALLAEGASWVKYDYNDDANLMRVHSTSGRSIQLIYNSKRKIERLIDSENGILDFEYNDAGKPVFISMADVGAITVDYDAFGEITQVEGKTFDGSEGGQQVALKITQVFQNLLALAKPASANRLLAETSPAFEAALEAASSSGSVSQTIQAIELAQQRNFTNSKSMTHIDRLAMQAMQGGLGSANAATFADFGEKLYDLYAMVSPFGVPADRWATWEAYIARAEERGAERPIAAMLSRIRRDPLKPMTRAEWEDFDQLRNPGYWYVDLPSSFLSPNLRGGLEYDAVISRKNGDLVVASNVGLVARRNGVWKRYSFDQDRGGFLLADNGASAGTPLTITDFADLPGNMLAVATNRGIYFLGEDYAQVAARLSTPSDGLPAMFVQGLHRDGSTLYAATGQGLASIQLNSDGTLGNVSTLASGDFSFIAGGPQGRVIAGGASGVFEINGTNVGQLYSSGADSAAYSPSDRRLILQSSEQLMTAQWNGSGFSSVVPLTNAASARLGQGGGGLAVMPVEGQQTVVAMGGEGYALWRNGYFEYRPLPRSNGFPAVKALDINNSQAIAAADNGSLYRFNPLAVDKRGTSAVKSSAYDSANDLAYFADGRSIQIATPSPRGEAATISTLAFVDATHLDIAADGSLIANDGNAILRFGAGKTEAEVLFLANPHCPDDYQRGCQNGLTGLISASDGSVWATAGGSAFRWQDGSVREYSTFKDNNDFPVNSAWLAGIVELDGGDIVISASNESHLSYRGVDWDGQNVVYSGGKFEKFSDAAIFISGTRTDDALIVGSTRGFYEAQGRSLTDLARASDPAYIALRDAHPNLYLGGEGATIGENTWLFPTPAGVVGYQNGVWFYPDRLNWQYPDANKADIGARHTYTLQIDKAGRIYAGTDSGLMVFQPRGGDAVEFLIQNNRSDLAFATTERRKLTKEADIILGALKPGQPEYGKVKAVIDAKKRLETHRTGTTRSGGMAAAVERGETVGGDAFADELRRREREYFRLLSQLEQTEPGLAQLVTIKPLELAALQRQIPDGAVVVQYIPQPDKLLLHVISRDSHVVREVEVDIDALMDSAFRSNFWLESLVPEMEGLMAQQGSIFSASEGEPMATDTQVGDLAALYELLFGPIEQDIEGYGRVYVSAAGVLNYTPFSALTRVRGENREYAVERYNLAMVPTSYLLSLVMQDNSANAVSALILGDPDGTLANAKVEAAEIGQKVQSYSDQVIVRTGNDATIQVLTEFGRTARLLHFATHGKLNSSEPERSYLVMGDGQRLSTIDIMTMDLTDAELAFLSACETGKGADGLEYATLARAFSHAGVPTTIASLWQVGDAATLNLANSFYQTYDGDAMASLADAQRAMIAEDGPLSHPAAWSSFQVYGRGWTVQP